MARIKSNFSGLKASLPPSLGSSVREGTGSKSGLPRDLTARLLAGTLSPSQPRALDFGTLHTKASVATQSGSQWKGLLTAASGGISSILGGGLLSSGGLGFIGKLLSLFGGGKSTPAAPVQFQSPLTRQKSFDVGSRGHTSMALSANSVTAGLSRTGIYQNLASGVHGQHAHSEQVIQIVRQALLTSSSLNDVISEI